MGEGQASPTREAYILRKAAIIINKQKNGITFQRNIVAYGNKQHEAMDATQKLLLA